MRKAVAVLVALLLVLQVGVLAGCSKGNSSPVQAADAFFSAMKKKNAEKVVSLLDPVAMEEEAEYADITVKEFKEQLIEQLESLFAEMEEMTYSIGKPDIDGDKARVEVTVVTKEWGEEKDTLDLIKRGGKWFVLP